MDQDVFRRLGRIYAEAARTAPALHARFERAGFDIASIACLDDLSALPVLKKERLVELQRANPPFGGFLPQAAGRSMRRIYVSPGPIYEPALGDGAHGLDLLFRAAGLGPDDIVLNTWSYHLVPAGLLFDEAAAMVGATVIPAGTGNRELQARILVETRATAICASTAFFLELARLTFDTWGPEAWSVKRSFLGGEMGDWAAKRRTIEKDYRVSTWAAYATADVGLVACEDGQGEGYAVHPRCLVQICDPDTGVPVAPGEAGEIVVTAFDAHWPMIRFGTGDKAFALAQGADGRVLRLSPLQGRVGRALKVREIFVYPRSIEQVVAGTAGLGAAQGVVREVDNRDHLTLRLVLEDGADADAVREHALRLFQQTCRIRADETTLVASQPADAPLLVRLGPEG